MGPFPELQAFLPLAVEVLMEKSMGTASPKAGEGWVGEQSPSLLLSLPLAHRLLAALPLPDSGWALAGRAVAAIP